MTNQQTLGGNAVSIQEPSTVDKHRGCVAKTGEPDEDGNKSKHGVTPFLTAVSPTGVRTPVCRIHARKSWINEYETNDQ